MRAGLVECFRQDERRGESHEGSISAEAAPKERGDGGGGAVLACRLCRRAVTTRGDAVDVDGSHEHTFFNPAGVLFEIACFGAAPGCVVTGRPTDEFSWFAGYRWAFASCVCCGAHLGWRFDGRGGGFFGLISTRIVEIEVEDDVR